MKIILIRPHDRGEINPRLPSSISEIRGVVPPLGLAYIASVLEVEGYDVNILDVKALNLSGEQTKKLIIQAGADVVGITAMTSTVREALEVAKMAKEAGSLVVMGGPQIAAYPKETLQYGFIDYGIRGEGEYSLLELIKSLESAKPIENIPGLVYKKKAKVYMNAPSIVGDLDKLPFPALHLLPMDKYSSVIGTGQIATMVTSRGCPYHCGFCFKQPQDKLVRWRNVEKIVDEIESIIKKHNITEIMFYDDTVTLNREHIWGLCDEILSRGLKIFWEAPSRVDRVDLELLRMMKRAGCMRLRYGVESGDPQILKLMKKDITLSQVKNAFRWTKEAQIETFAYFIIGYANETPQTIKRTILFAKQLNADSVMFNLAVPYPHTDLYRLAQERGVYKGDYWRDYTLGLQNDPLPYLINHADAWARKAYRDFYFQPDFVIKSLLKIRSWETLKNYFAAAKGLLFFKFN